MDTKTYEPVWPGIFENWSRAYIARNHWRVSHLYDYEEAVQECALIFARCCNYYRGEIDNPAWFMALYKRAVANDFHTFATRNAHAVEAQREWWFTHPDGPGGGTTTAPSEAMAALQNASDELKLVLKTIASAPSEFLEILLKQSNLKKWNRRLLRLSGISEVKDTDVLTELKTLLGP